jgi:DDB1- and CUL4-associated factor 13
MQVVNAVQFTVDSHYVLSGSEDMNLRMWKSVAWRPTGTPNAREERAIEYREKLIEKYSHSHKIRRIATHRHLPKYILNANKRKQDQGVSKLKKKLNREANTGVLDSTVGQKKVLVESIEIPE